MGAACPVLLLAEDSQLDDVAEILRRLGAPFELRKGSEAVGPVVLPRDLLLATARKALALPPSPRGVLEARGPARVAIVECDSPGLRTGLREAGFDLLVRRPVHPTALRLLLLRLLYRGPERRREPRVSVGAATRYRTGFLWRRAVLTELSVGGCRLLTYRPATPGWRIGVEVPDPSGSPLRIAGRVVRSNAVSPTDPTCTLAVSFGKLTDPTIDRLARIISAHESGPASLPDGCEIEEASQEMAAPELLAAEPEVEPGEGAESGITSESPGEAAPEPGPVERRRSARPAYGMRVVTLGEEAARVVMGRDLSSGGIRIEPHGGLERGQRLTLALHGGGLAVPLVVRGAVLRDDGDAGLVIRFDPLTAVQSEALGKILAGLGDIESLASQTAGTPQLVTHIVET